MSAPQPQQPRLPGMTQRPVEEPRPLRVPAWVWVAGGLVLVVGAVVALVVMLSTGWLLPATSGIALVLIPVGIVVAGRGLALQRRRRSATARPPVEPDEA